MISKPYTEWDDIEYITEYLQLSYDTVHELLHNDIEQGIYDSIVSFPIDIPVYDYRTYILKSHRIRRMVDSFQIYNHRLSMQDVLRLARLSLGHMDSKGLL